MGRFDHPPFETSCKIVGDRIVINIEGELAFVEPYGPDAIRFRSSKSLRIDETLNWNLLPAEKSTAVTITMDGNRAVLRNGKAVAEVFGDGTVNYLREDGRHILDEYWLDNRSKWANIRKARVYKTQSGDMFKLDLYFKANPKEHFYGMGQEANDCFDLKGSTSALEHRNTKCSIPFYYSTLDYGFLWNNPSIGRAELTQNHTLWHADCARQIDYVIIAGDSPAQVMERYTALTGRAAVLPEWAAGFWQSKLRYVNQEELLTVAREYHKRQIPLSVIVIDYFHWTQQGDFKFDPEYWPDPKAMVDELAAMGIRAVTSVWPTCDTRSENYAYMRSHNMLVNPENGVPAFNLFLGALGYIDPTNPETRSHVWSLIKKNYYDKGIRAFWLDEAEPGMIPYQHENFRCLLGNGAEVSNLYPYYYAKLFNEGLAAEGEKEIAQLARCAWFGSQRENVIMWSGDIASTFDSLRQQVKAGLNFSFSGLPWWTTDIGGFFGGHPDDPAYRELLIRWFQFGTFCPVFRLHGNRLPSPEKRSPFDPNAFCYSGGNNEIWSYGEEAYEILRDLILLRERIKPYIMAQFAIAAKTGTPVMRPLLFDFLTDDKTYTIGDEFMFGPDLLVAPVIEAKQSSRLVYLPLGSHWWEVSTGKEYAGGVFVEAAADIRTIPLFLKDGAVISGLKK